MRSPSRSPGPKSFKVGAVFVRKKIIRESSDVKSFGSLFGDSLVFRVQDVVEGCCRCFRHRCCYADIVVATVVVVDVDVVVEVCLDARRAPKGGSSERLVAVGQTRLRGEPQVIGESRTRFPTQISPTPQASDTQCPANG